MIKLLWFPTFTCNNYGRPGEPNPHCRYCDQNYDLASERLTIRGELLASGRICDPKKFVDFMVRNAAAVGKKFDMAGGEPLTHPLIVETLTSLVQRGFRWSVTSNTLLTDRITRMNHLFPFCDSWTVSVHSYNGDKWERLANNVRYIKARCAGRVSGTIVIAPENMAILGNLERGAKSLPFDGIQYHIDANLNVEQSKEIMAQAKRILSPGSRMVMSGYQPAGVMCNRWGVFLVVNPDGVLYECTLKAFRGIDPIGDIDGIDLSKLDPAPAWCDLRCAASCNQQKHHDPKPPPHVFL